MLYKMYKMIFTKSFRIVSKNGLLFNLLVMNHRTYDSSALIAVLSKPWSHSSASLNIVRSSKVGERRIPAWTTALSINLGAEEFLQARKKNSASFVCDLEIFFKRIYLQKGGRVPFLKTFFV